MTASLPDLRASAILLDIEGTTTPLSFVYEVLFPYARANAKRFLERHLSSPEVLEDVVRLHNEHAEDVRNELNPPSLQDSASRAHVESLVAYIHWLIDRDRKTAPLKSLQGKIWEDGYETGELRGQIFKDVPPALERWQCQGREVSIFSSGSVLAQKLLFAHTTAGNLTKFIGRYFDTAVGPKTAPLSYRRIAVDVRRLPPQVLFVSDVTGELDAAASAGMRTLLSVRPGNHPQLESSIHTVIRTFDEVFP
jgi:enolase-phosphatase E1